ncbi:MAG: FixH family protein [Burkholderiales bacterium]|jgi:hypothetical protein|nr:FixH family protein [Burkholderiales bacterium]
MSEENNVAKPWYREIWPWVVIGSLSTVILACFVTFYFALRAWDGLVDDDYYKKGLEINKTMERVEKSHALSLEASLMLLQDGTVRVVLATPNPDFVAPDTVTLRMVHSRYPDQDRVTTLHHVDGLVFVGEVVPPDKGRWRIALETSEWRLTAEAQAPLDEVHLSAVNGNPQP